MLPGLICDWIFIATMIYRAMIYEELYYTRAWYTTPSNIPYIGQLKIGASLRRSLTKRPATAVGDQPAETQQLTGPVEDAQQLPLPGWDIFKVLCHICHMQDEIYLQSFYI